MTFVLGSKASVNPLLVCFVTKYLMDTSGATLAELLISSITLSLFDTHTFLIIGVTQT